MFGRIWRNQYSVISRFVFNSYSSHIYEHRLVATFCTTVEKQTTFVDESKFLKNLNAQKMESLIESGKQDDLEILNRSLQLAKQTLGESSTQYNRKLFKASKLLLKYNLDNEAQKYMLKNYDLKNKYPNLKNKLPPIQQVQMELAAFYSKYKNKKQTKRFYKKYIQNLSHVSQNIHRLYTCYAQLGKIYAEQKNYQKAIEYMRKNIEIIALATTDNLQYQFSSLFLIEHQWRKIVDFVVILYLKGQPNQANRFLLNFVQLLSPSSIIYQQNLEEAQKCLQKIGIKNQFLQVKIEQQRKRKQKK